ncbi:MAG: hypothetical protein AB7S26_41590 [Sandaracinaceae bacterium]
MFVRFVDRVSAETSNPFPGSIVAGHLEAGGVGYAFSFPFFEARYGITDPRLRFELFELDPGEGTLGGAITLDSLGLDPTIRPTIEPLADLYPSAADPTICAAMSIGIAFTASPEPP